MFESKGNDGNGKQVDKVIELAMREHLTSRS
jgi:hypothetical protein